MSDSSRTVPFADIADRIGAPATGTAARHRAARSGSAARVAAGVAAGAALTGGIAAAAAPAASAQQLPDPAAIGQMVSDAARSAGSSDGQIQEYAQQYVGAPGLGSVELPIPGLAHSPTAPAEITSPFGPRWGGFHNGIDLGVNIGTPLYAVKSGVVENSGPADGYGLWIRIRTDDGYLLEYGHNNANYVEVGQRVVAGQVIGESGNRGWSTGPHLHFGVQDPFGNWIDPVPWLAANGVFV